jgi:hypothetical protein
MQDESTPHGYCECGCGEKTVVNRWANRHHGHAKGQPRRFLQGHQHRKTVAPACGYIVDAETGCWIWKLGLDRAGYGKTKRGGISVHAHIALWRDRHGPVPDGLELDHLCRTPACCNPDHLEAVTPTENKRRGRATKLSAADVAAIKASGDTNKALAARFGVDPSNISHIRRGFSWKDVDAA